MYTSMSCAWTGALLEMGSMAGLVWSKLSQIHLSLISTNTRTPPVLLRSLYTHLRVCWDIELTKPRFKWIAHALGWGLPALFLAISLPITKLSYRLTSTCLPNPHESFITWFGWLIAFALLGALLQFATTGFCLVVFLRSYLSASKAPCGPRFGNSTQGTATSAPPSITSTRRVAWRRVQQVLALQWRNILLSFVVIIDVVYSGIVYVLMTNTEDKDNSSTQTNQINEWSSCLIESSGNKAECLELAKPLRLGEGQVVATLFMASVRVIWCGWTRS